MRRIIRVLLSDLRCVDSHFDSIALCAQSDVSSTPQITPSTPLNDSKNAISGPALNNSPTMFAEGHKLTYKQKPYP
jgi:hypothetical protein